MKQLTPFQNFLYAAGGILLLTGAALPILTTDMMWPFLVFATGAALFSTLQARESYEGKNFVIKRLRRQQLTGAVLLLITATLMFTRWQQLSPFRADEWKITLAIAAVFEIYTAFRIPAELRKEQSDNSENESVTQ